MILSEARPRRIYGGVLLIFSNTFSKTDAIFCIISLFVCFFHAKNSIKNKQNHPSESFRGLLRVKSLGLKA